MRRWFARTFLTRVTYRPDPECWSVERPDWWTIGETSGVTDVSVEVARARLDEWQDDLYRRAKAKRRAGVPA